MVTMNLAKKSARHLPVWSAIFAAGIICDVLNCGGPATPASPWPSSMRCSDVRLTRQSEHTASGPTSSSSLTSIFQPSLLTTSAVKVSAIVAVAIFDAVLWRQTVPSRVFDSSVGARRVKAHGTIVIYCHRRLHLQSSETSSTVITDVICCRRWLHLLSSLMSSVIVAVGDGLHHHRCGALTSDRTLAGVWLSWSTPRHVPRRHHRWRHLLPAERGAAYYVAVEGLTASLRCRDPSRLLRHDWLRRYIVTSQPLPRQVPRQVPRPSTKMMMNL